MLGWRTNKTGQVEFDEFESCLLVVSSQAESRKGALAVVARETVALQDRQTVPRDSQLPRSQQPGGVLFLEGPRRNKLLLDTKTMAINMIVRGICWTVEDGWRCAGV